MKHRKIPKHKLRLMSKEQLIIEELKVEKLISKALEYQDDVNYLIDNYKFV